MESLAKKYPKYYKALPPGVKPDEVDTYVINAMFPVDDPSGTIIHARKKLLIPGVRSGGKSMLKDIIEARDTLNRYIALYDVVAEPSEPTEELLPAGTVTENGWIVHAGNEMPEALYFDDLVEVRMADSDLEYTGNFAKPAKEWKWFTDGRCTAISHYRLANIQHEIPELDNWKPLTVNRIPDGLDPDEMVEVMVDDDVVILMAKRANEWDWKYRSAGTLASAPHITHWRRYRHGA